MKQERVKEAKEIKWKGKERKKEGGKKQKG